MNRYKLSNGAQGDLESICAYLRLEASAERAIQIALDITDEFQKLGDMPGMGHFRDDVIGREFRFWRVHSHLICYRWDVSPIQIIAVVHGSRNLNAFFEDRASDADQ
jgi:plasmid stabilization system protein ParE